MMHPDLAQMLVDDISRIARAGPDHAICLVVSRELEE